MEKVQQTLLLRRCHVKTCLFQLSFNIRSFSFLTETFLVPSHQPGLVDPPLFFSEHRTSSQHLMNISSRWLSLRTWNFRSKTVIRSNYPKLSCPKLLLQKQQTFEKVNISQSEGSQLKTSKHCGGKCLRSSQPRNLRIDVGLKSNLEERQLL